MPAIHVQPIGNEQYSVVLLAGAHVNGGSTGGRVCEDRKELDAFLRSLQVPEEIIQGEFTEEMFIPFD